MVRYTSTCLLEDLLGSCTKLVLDALRVPDANSLMCNFFLGLNETIAVGKSFTGEHKTHAKPQCEWIAMTTKRMVKRKKAAYLISANRQFVYWHLLTPEAMIIYLNHSPCLRFVFALL